MKALINCGSVTIETDDHSSARELFFQIAEAQKVFADSGCGLCGSGSLKFVVRESGQNVFREIICTRCQAKLTYGESRESGELYAVRKLTAEGKPSWKDGAYGAHNGWTKYRGQNTQQSEF